MIVRAVSLASFFVLAFGVATTPDTVQGCAPAPREGQRVGVTDEAAFIIWDDAARKEHFIRRATFTGDAMDFGFLVPTPTRPEIEAANDDLFAELARITAPAVEHRTARNWGLGCFMASKEPPAAGETTPGAVVVLEQKRVGNLDATVLKFRSDKTQKPEDAADELIAWLKRNGYAVRPDLTAWLVPYIHNQWIITAFKIAAGDGAAPPKSDPKGISLRSTAVRMSFDTPRPFFPYREPEYQREDPDRAPRLLRVFVAAKQRMRATIGDGATEWPGRTVWANAITAAERAAVIERCGKLSPGTMAGKWWITEFEDRSSPRPGYDELYFTPSLDHSVVLRPPQVFVTYKSPGWFAPLVIGVPLVLLIGGVVIWRRAARQPLDIPMSDRPPTAL